MDIKAETKLAIALEQEGYDIYLRAAASTQNPLAKNTLLAIARRELIHIERIKRLYADLLGSAIDIPWINQVSITPEKLEIIRPLLQALKEALHGQKFEKEIDTGKIYEAAMQLEKNTYTVYTRIAEDKDTEEEIKKFYSALAREENLHFEIFQDTLFYLNDPEEYFHKQERWIVEG